MVLIIKWHYEAGSLVILYLAMDTAFFKWKINCYTTDLEFLIILPSPPKRSGRA